MLRLALLLLASSLAPTLRAQEAPAPRPPAPSVEPQLIRALSDLYQGDPARAITSLSTVLEAHPGDPVVLDVLAEAYHADGQLAQALYHAELAAERAPQDAAILHRLADLYAASGDAPRAAQTRERADRIAPRPASIATRPAPADAPARPAPLPPAETSGEIAGLEAYRAGRYADAANALLEALDADPRQLDAWPLALDALTRTSDARAGDTADLAVLLYPTVPAILVPAAEAFAALGRTDEARDAATSALRVLGESGDAELRARGQSLLSSLR